MEETLASIDGGRNGSPFHHGHQTTFEELQQLLACVSMELESTRQAAKAQGTLHEARVRHLEELLKTVRREKEELMQKVIQLQCRLQLSGSRSLGSGMTEPTRDPQIRDLSGMQPLESVASMSILTAEAHRKMQGQQQLDVKKQMEYVSSMNEPTRETLSEVHRKLQEQQQQLELQQMEMQNLHHRREMQRQHSRSSMDMRTSSTASRLEFQQQQQQHLDELRQHLEIHQKDDLQEPLHMDIVINDRKPGEFPHGEVDNGSDAKSTTWNEFPSGVHLDMRSSSDRCLILDSPEHMHIKLTQGLPSPHVDERSPPQLEDLPQQLQHHQDDNMQLHHQADDDMQIHLRRHQQMQQQQHHQADDDMQIQLRHHQQLHQQQDDNMQRHLHQQQHESEQLLSHMQHGQTAASCGLRMQDEQQPLRRQLSKHQDGRPPMPAGGLQGTNGVINMSVLQLQHQQQQQHSAWPSGLMGLSPRALSNGCQNGVSEQLLQSACLQSGSVVASILSPLEQFGDSAPSSLLLPRPVHLPEPPEADPQVVLNSLPEKGKLLHAVMQAGPLLETLLLAGPLPQWRHPPPPLDAEEIPRVSMGAVSMGATVGVKPPVEQAIGLMASHGSSLEQVMRLSAPLQSSPSQNGFCH